MARSRTKTGYPTPSFIEARVEHARTKLEMKVGGIRIAPDGSLEILDERAAQRAPMDEFERLQSEGKL